MNRATVEADPKTVGRTEHPVQNRRGGTSSLWTVVATRELTVKLTDKNFILSTVLSLAILVAVFAVQAFMASGMSENKIALVGEAGKPLAQAAEQIGKAAADEIKLTPVPVADADAARKAVEDKSADVALIQQDGGWVLIGLDRRDSQLEAYLGQAIRADALQRNAAQFGTSPEALLQGSQVRYELLKGEDNAMVAWIATFVLAMLFYMASIMFGTAIANSVLEEKQSRIVEILTTAIPVRQLLIGKVAGNTAIALGQMLLFAAAGLIGIRFTEFKSFLPAVSASTVWFLAFFVAGFLALAGMWAVAGALASRSEDLQSTTLPLTMTLVIALFAGIYASGKALVIASFIPVVSVVAMPSRLLRESASWWEALISLAVTAAFAFATIVLADRMYRRAVLQTRRVGFKEAFATD